MIEKISAKFFVMINKDGGGQFLDFVGDTTVMRGGISLMGVPPVPSTGENPDQRWSDIYVVFTKILCSRNFCVW